MKKTNKGFSMVELIIVIAIMAILAGALAPALIKYINKSRLSTDIQTASSIATAVQTALGNEKGYDDASAQGYSGKWTKVSSTLYSKTDAFAKSVQETVGKTAPKVKGKKCMNKTSPAAYGDEFEIYVDPIGNEVYVACGSPSGLSNGKVSTGHMLYPNADSCLTDDSATSCH